MYDNLSLIEENVDRLRGNSRNSRVILNTEPTISYERKRMNKTEILTHCGNDMNTTNNTIIDNSQYNSDKNQYYCNYTLPNYTSNQDNNTIKFYNSS